MYNSPTLHSRKCESLMHPDDACWLQEQFLLHDQAMVLSCDVVSLQIWKKSDDHTESRQYRTNHSQETSSVSCVITYELFNLVKWVPVFVWYDSFSHVHGCETIFYIYFSSSSSGSQQISETLLPTPFSSTNSIFFISQKSSAHLHPYTSSSPSGQCLSQSLESSSLSFSPWMRSSTPA